MGALPAPRPPAASRALAWRSRLQQLQHLPRDTRDTLFQLAVIGWTIAPHLLHLPAWCGPMVLGLLLWRARLALSAGALPSRWVVTALLVLASGLTLWGENTLLGKEAGVTLLVVLMSLKTLELRARRDALVVFFLGFFLVLTHFFYSQNLGTGLWLVAAVWGLLTALVLAHMPVGRPTLKRAGAVAARATLLGLPVMLVLFMLFPRLGPLWGLPQDAQGRTGLSGSLRLGGVASVAEDDSIALRIKFEGSPPPPSQLYFRGPVLSTFDGREWVRLVPNYPAQQRPRLNLQLQGQPLRYEMTLEPNQLPVLPLLELTPDSASAPTADTLTPKVDGWLLSLRPDGQWQSDRPVTERVRVQGSAWLQHGHGPTQSVPGLRDLIDLPPSTNARTLVWAADLRARLLPATPLGSIDNTSAQQAQQLSSAVLQHITQGGYTYTLEPGTYSGDAIDDFWLDRKLGFCEHFASAYVVVMRAMGVPARVVTGYQGADPVPQDGYYIVRQRNAHAWAEYWQAGTGWVRVDPTAAVAPDRVSTGRSLRPPPGLVGGAINRINPALAAQVRATWERANNRWNQWVLNYSRGQQTSLLKALGFEAPSWQDLASLMILLLCSAALVGAGWAWWDRRRQDPWQRLQQRVAQRLAALGVTVLPHHAPRARGACVRVHLGLRGEALALQLDTLDQRRYGSTAPLPASALAPWFRTFAATARATMPVQVNRTG
jgi:protein-glutamine gamma-glutamyltransferase